MAFSNYTGDTDIIASLGTTPEERGLTTDQFKAKFDEFAAEFVAWFNATHIAEGDAHLAETATQSVLGHVLLPEPGITATLENGWLHVPGVTLQYFRDAFGFVHISGAISDGVATLGTVVTTLPTGYRPRCNMMLLSEKPNDGSIGVFFVNADGPIKIRVNNGTGTFYINGSFKTT